MIRFRDPNRPLGRPAKKREALSPAGTISRKPRGRPVDSKRAKAKTESVVLRVMFMRFLVEQYAPQFMNEIDAYPRDWYLDLDGKLRMKRSGQRGRRNSMHVATKIADACINRRRTPQDYQNVEKWLSAPARGVPVALKPQLREFLLRLS